MHVTVNKEHSHMLFVHFSMIQRQPPQNPNVQRRGVCSCAAHVCWNHLRGGSWRPERLRVPSISNPSVAASSVYPSLPLPRRHPKAQRRGRVLLRGTRLMEPPSRGFCQPERLRAPSTSPPSVATSSHKSQMAFRSAASRPSSLPPSA